MKTHLKDDSHAQLQNDLNHNDKKHKQHDKVVEDWRSKVDEALKQVEEANKEARLGSLWGQ